MINCYDKPATSDDTSIINQMVSNDVGHESGIGSSDNDSISGWDRALTPSTPSSQLSLDCRTSTSGHMTSSEFDEPDLQHLAEQYASDVPQDVMNLRLEEEYARLVLPPPPYADSKPEVNSMPEVETVQFRLPVEKRPAHRLPLVSFSEMRLDELRDLVPRLHPKEVRDTEATKKDQGTKQQPQQQEKEDSTELCRRAALSCPASDVTDVAITSRVSKQSSNSYSTSIALYRLSNTCNVCN